MTATESLNGALPRVGAGPTTLYWYMTNTCNQRCAHCWVTAGSEFGTRAARFEELRMFLGDAITSGLQFVKLTGGEPMIYRDFKPACDYFAANGVKIWLETNGIRIDDEWADYFSKVGADVGLSLDDVDPARHDEFRGTSDSWSQTVEGARKMLARGVTVGFTSCLTDSSLHTMADMVGLLLDEIGADSVAFNPIIPFGRAKESGGRDWRPYLDEMLARYEELVPRYGRDRVVINLPAAFTTSAMHQRCMLGDDIISILSDGSISICGFGIEDGDAVTFGDARTQLISDLWHSHPGIQRLRTPGLGRLKGICSNCVFSNSCRGYCRAQALAEYDDVDAPYPICQHFAEQGLFPAHYLIDPAAEIEYKSNPADKAFTSEILPKGLSQLRMIPLTPVSR